MADIDYDRSTKRLFGLTVFIGCAGFVTQLRTFGERGRVMDSDWAALAALVNLWLWECVAESLSWKKGKRSTFAGALFVGGRLLALFAFGYVIVSYLDVSPLRHWSACLRARCGTGRNRFRIGCFQAAFPVRHRRIGMEQELWITAPFNQFLAEPANAVSQCSRVTSRRSCASLGKLAEPLKS